MPKPSRPSTRHIHRSSPTLLHHGVQLLVEVLRLLVQRVELQQTLAEQTRLAQLAQLVVGVGNVVDAFVGLESVINHQGARVIESGLLVIDGQQAKPSGSVCRSQCREDTLPSPSIV